MSRYIDADILKDKTTRVNNIWNCTTNAEGKGLDEIIDDIPTADVRENVRGEWIDCTEDGYVECPFCHSATNCEGNKEELHFCFSCGAEMRGEREEESVDEDDIQPHVCSTCHWCLNDWHQEPCNICAHGSKWKDGR